MINPLIVWRYGIGLTLIGLILLLVAGWVIAGVVITALGISLIWGSTYD